jgi:hypothetical protein
MNSGAFFCACVMDCLVLCVYGGGMVFFFCGFLVGDLDWGFYHFKSNDFFHV